MQTNVVLFKNSRKADLKSIEIVKQALFILERIEGQKLTEKGFLPRKLVTEFWETHLKEVEIFRPYREADCRQLHRLHFLLTESGYVKRRSGRVWRTKLANDVLSAGDFRSLYRALFFNMLVVYDWGFDDRFPEYEEIQEVGLEMIEVLMSKDQISARELFSEFFEALKNIEHYDRLDEIGYMLSDPVMCLQLRFLNRFCLPFGILTSSRDPRDPFGTVDDVYRTTEFFRHEFASIIEEEPLDAH